MLIEARQNNKPGKENIAARIVILAVIHAVDQGKVTLQFLTIITERLKCH